jgi:protein subunit release factor A
MMYELNLRTYVLDPYDRVTDHRTNLAMKASELLAGRLQPMLNAATRWRDRHDRHPPHPDAWRAQTLD